MCSPPCRGRPPRGRPRAVPRAATGELAPLGPGVVNLPRPGRAPRPERARPHRAGHSGWDSQVAFPADDTRLHGLVTWLVLQTVVETVSCAGTRLAGTPCRVGRACRTHRGRRGTRAARR